MGSVNDYMDMAIKEAFSGMRKRHGGPFGAVIVKDGKIVSKAHNEVLSSHDPTAHAEILAIRRASKKLGRHDLSDCEIYTTGEPCPMCLSAIHWSRIKSVYYGFTRKDAEKIGFDDNLIYDIIKGTKRKKFSYKQLGRKDCLKLIDNWDGELY